MRVISKSEMEAVLSYPELIDVLRDAFARGVIAPPRHHHTDALDGRPPATLLLMPAWEASGPGSTTAGRYGGVKLVTVYPDNGTRGLPSIMGTYVLISATDGAPLALLDGPAITVWRTAAASALAARYLARPDAQSLLILGAGALAPYLVRAHAAVRRLKRVVLWNRTRERAERLARLLGITGLEISITADLESAAKSADIISTATLSRAPLIMGDWLRPGTHLDCVGAFKPDMREVDATAIRRASVWVDTRAGALVEGGDLVQAAAAGVFTAQDVVGDLAQLVRDEAPGRSSSEQITLFKSVGASIEDLATAISVYEALS